MNIAESTVLITGATDGLGKAVASRLAASGARVLLHGRSAEKGAKTLREISGASASRRIEYHRADFASLQEVRRLAGEISQKHDRLQVLINNAGIGFGPPGAAPRRGS